MTGASSQAAFGLLQEYEPADAVAGVDPDRLRPTSIIFAEGKPGMLAAPQPLKGDYQLTLLAVLTTDKAQISAESLTVTGRVSGLLGTDSSRRDLWSGVIAGIKWALLIGLLTAFVSVAIGVIWGVTAAYFGGPVNWLMQRIFEIFSNQPLLPLLIVISAIFKPSIWFLIVIMSVFFWTGPVKTVYAMALQIREETFIEASRALGAGSWRLIFRHMVPLLIPYAFASMALSVPGAVVYESTVSLLGLGDASIVTWGQILHDAFTGGAVLGGLWWWVVPPGLMISLMGMTFSFIGFAMDAILHPKLRTTVGGSVGTPSSAFRTSRFTTSRGKVPVRAVDDVSFDLARGETLGLVGESGCGKTSLGTALLAMPAPPGKIVGGRILMEGTDILTLSGTGAAPAASAGRKSPWSSRAP